MYLCAFHFILTNRFRDTIWFIDLTLCSVFMFFDGLFFIFLIRGIKRNPHIIAIFSVCNYTNRIASILFPIMCVIGQFVIPMLYTFYIYWPLISNILCVMHLLTTMILLVKYTNMSNRKFKVCYMLNYLIIVSYCVVIEVCTRLGDCTSRRTLGWVMIALFILPTIITIGLFIPQYINELKTIIQKWRKKKKISKIKA